jgi:hypothetical protein
MTNLTNPLKYKNRDHDKVGPLDMSETLSPDRNHDKVGPQDMSETLSPEIMTK